MTLDFELSSNSSNLSYTNIKNDINLYTLPKTHVKNKTTLHINNHINNNNPHISNIDNITTPVLC